MHSADFEQGAYTAFAFYSSNGAERQEASRVNPRLVDVATSCLRIALAVDSRSHFLPKGFYRCEGYDGELLLLRFA